MVGQCERNSGEDEFGVLFESEVSGGSISVQNMARARDDESFRENAHKEHCNTSCQKLETPEPHARENFV